MKIIKTSVTQQIIEYIKENIQNGSWKVGEKIPSEPSLVEELGVSRASLRVAIQQYVALGVLRSEQGKGTYLESSDLDAVLGNKNSVSFSDFSNIEKVLEFRRIIEPEATYMAAKKPKEELDKLISILRKHYEVMEKSVGQASDFIAADMNFHREIAFASGNEIIGNTIAFVFSTLILSWNRHPQADLLHFRHLGTGLYTLGDGLILFKQHSLGVGIVLFGNQTDEIRLKVKSK